MNSESALRARRGCSPLTEPELEIFRSRLVARQSEVSRSMVGLSEASLRTPTDGSSVPLHTADLASETFEQNLSLDCLARAQDELVQLRDALERIDNRSFGLCNDCGTAISAARLDAMPTAEYCIDCKSRLEME